jgi:hypothetical protein
MVTLPKLMSVRIRLIEEAATTDEAKAKARAHYLTIRQVGLLTALYQVNS